MASRTFRGAVWVCLCGYVRGLLNFRPRVTREGLTERRTFEGRTEEASLPTVWPPGTRAWQAEGVEVQRP